MNYIKEIQHLNKTNARIITYYDTKIISAESIVCISSDPIGTQVVTTHGLTPHYSTIECLKSMALYWNCVYFFGYYGTNGIYYLYNATYHDLDNNEHRLTKGEILGAHYHAINSDFVNIEMIVNDEL